jgi:hypothetical protein
MARAATDGGDQVLPSLDPIVGFRELGRAGKDECRHRQHHRERQADPISPLHVS